jgi:N-methylhydantoinase B/oxoprolinase/acetone carboxylase alpha subunit
VNGNNGVIEEYSFHNEGGGYGEFQGGNGQYLTFQSYLMKLF